MIDEATHNQLNQASYANGWEIEAIIETTPRQGEVEVQGLVMFKQRSPVPSNPGSWYGVATYVGDNDTKQGTHTIHFGNGQYDLTRDVALHEVAERAKRG